MSICSRHIERNDYCDSCYTGVVECSCGKSESCSQCGGKGWFVGSGKAKYQKLEDLDKVAQHG